MDKAATVAIIGPVVWGGVWGHGPELARYLGRSNDVLYLNPIVPAGATAPSFRNTGAYPAAAGVRVVERRSGLRPGVLYGLAMEWRNFTAVFRSKPGYLVAYYPVGALLALVWCRLSGARALFVYADFPDILRHRLARLAARVVGLPLAARLASAGSVATSRLLQEDLLKHSRRCSFVPNGIDLSRLGEKSGTASGETRRPDSDRPFRVGFVGFFGEWIDLEVVLEAARLCPAVEFVMVGDGPRREELENQARALDNVRLTGTLPHDRVFAEIRHMDLGLVPFKVNRVTDRVCPVKLFEYWAMGKPVLATGCRELLRVSGEAPKALTIFSGAGELAELIRLLSRDREALAAAGRESLRAVRDYDWKVLGARIERQLKGEEPGG
ncbi:MAG: glycosyltransferase [Candidatus Glassbacteria bacterium]|nr:glycosyltransferase [Candidatus Glassbacteria bacterium]